MSKGFDQNQERKSKVAALGKELTRRSRSRCEMCDDAGVSLSVFEVPPVSDEPDAEKSLFVCGDCHSQFTHPKRIYGDYWRCLARSIWSETLAVQVMSARILDRLSKKEQWAREILEDVEFEDDVEEWIKEEPL